MRFLRVNTKNSLNCSQSVLTGRLKNHAFVSVSASVVTD